MGNALNIFDATMEKLVYVSGQDLNALGVKIICRLAGMLVKLLSRCQV